MSKFEHHPMAVIVLFTDCFHFVLNCLLQLYFTVDYPIKFLESEITGSLYPFFKFIHI